MKKISRLQEKKCPICENLAYEWAIRYRIWNSDKCWNHMRSEERKVWLDKFKLHIQENKGFRPWKKEMEYFHGIYLEKNFERYKYVFWKKHYKKEMSYGEDFELTPDEEARIVDELYNDYVYQLEYEEKIYNLVGVDLTNFDFSECNLSFANFSEADLRGANFEESILKNAIIDSVIGDGINFSNADLSNTSITNSKLSNCFFLKTVIENCNFSKSILTNADFQDSRGPKPNFSQCDVSESVFTSSRIPEAIFENAKLNKVIFKGAQLFKSVFEGSEAKESTLVQCNIEEANLSRSNFEQSIFKDSILAGANICDTILTKTDLSNTDLTRCKLNEGTQLNYSDLRDSNLKNVDLYKAKLERTKVYYEDIEGANLFTNQLKGNFFVMERKQRTKIFISYSHSDQDFACKLASAIDSESIDVWIDLEEILVGDSLIAKIREGIDSSQYVCALLSKNSVRSQWVKNELDIAMTDQLERRKVKVLPLVIENDVELPGFLRGKLYIDFSREEDFPSGISQIMRRVNSIR